MYALREALALVCAEGLESLWTRHATCAQRLYEGLASLGLHLFISDPAKRTPTVSTIQVPEGVDWMKVTKYFMTKYEANFSVSNSHYTHGKPQNMIEKIITVNTFELNVN